MTKPTKWLCAQRRLGSAWASKTTYQHHLNRHMTKPTKWHVRPAKTQISLGIRPVWSESLLCAQWVAKDPSLLHADSEDSDQTGWMPRLICVFAGRTVTLLVLSWAGSSYFYFLVYSTPLIVVTCLQETPPVFLTWKNPRLWWRDRSATWRQRTPAVSGFWSSWDRSRSCLESASFFWHCLSLFLYYWQSMLNPHFSLLMMKWLN